MRLIHADLRKKTERKVKTKVITIFRFLKTFNAFAKKDPFSTKKDDANDEKLQVKKTKKFK